MKNLLLLAILCLSGTAGKSQFYLGLTKQEVLSKVEKKQLNSYNRIKNGEEQLFWTDTDKEELQSTFIATLNNGSVREVLIIPANSDVANLWLTFIQESFKRTATYQWQGLIKDKSVDIVFTDMTDSPVGTTSFKFTLSK